MALRLMQVVVPADQKEDLHSLIRGESRIESWDQTIDEKRYKLSILLPVDDSEHLITKLEHHFSNTGTFRIILYPVEATIPRPDDPDLERERGTAKENAAKQGKGRISREELYHDLVDSTRLSWVFIILMLASTVVAATGLLRNSEAIIIGSMVIAPLLGPNVALSLATTLADFHLAKNALKVTFAGIAISLVFAIALGLILEIDPTAHQISTRTKPNLGDIGLSLASGIAGALAFTTGVASALVGVMVAVALLPPLVVLGMLLGAGHWEAATGALLLLFINIICINLSGVLTFVIQGIKPANWDQEGTARNTSRVAISVWIFLLLILIFILYYSHLNFDFL
ncbi:TIGR00341 family protein [Marinilabilia salmonicolor]|uniref:TIGR00341 family protein n=1 Tax=Marinilabilia salmonicolor TaxID=989 RepID=UPI00031EA76B|nr:TIGR00341 family protein [Marinilabilia salmonicolor]